MSNHYTLHVSNVNTSTIHLRVAGEVDMAAAPVVMDAILGAALSNPTFEVRVDLDDVSFIDSMGLAALIEAHRRLADQQVRLVFGDVSANVRKLLEITGTADYLGVHAARPTAMSA
jgi:anti-anti-sigma factor